MAFTLSQIEYSSDHDEESEDEYATAAPKRQKVTNVWVEKEIFSNKTKAETKVSSELWGVPVKNYCKDGKHVTYYCREHGKLCQSKCKLFYPSTSLDIHYMENELPHEGGKIKILNSELKIFVNNLTSIGVTKPNKILHAVRESGLTEPPKSVLCNYLARKRKKQAKTHINVSDFLIWCQQHSEMTEDDLCSWVRLHH